MIKQIPEREAENVVEKFHLQNPICKQDFLVAYDILFSAINGRFKISEGATDPNASLSTSKWVEPSRVIAVIVHDRVVLTPALVTTIRSALGDMSGNFVVEIDCCPTMVYLFSPGQFLGTNKALLGDIAWLGL